MMMNRGIVAGVLGAGLLLGATACSQPDPDTSGLPTSMPALHLAAQGDQIRWCAINPVYSATYYVVVSGVPTGSVCGQGSEITQAEFEDLDLQEICTVSLPGGGTVEAFATERAASARLAQTYCDNA
ncbi:hypothetical protein [Gordonia sp. NPDC003376]